MDALQLLREDHRKVRDLFRQFDEADDASTKKAIVDEAVAELMVHAQLEEEIFYPAMAREGMKDLIDHAEEEHSAAENVMNELIGIDARDSALEAKFKVLIDMVTEHVTEEESAIFPRAAEIGMDRLETIGDRLQEMRQQIMTTPEPQRRKPRGRKAAASKTAGKRTTSSTRGSRAASITKTASRSRKTGTTAASRGTTKTAARATKTAAKKTAASASTTAKAARSTAKAAGKTVARAAKTAATTARKTATRATSTTRSTAKPATKTTTRKAGATRAKATTA